MSQARVHSFSISLDGFGTGDGITLDAPMSPRYAAGLTTSGLKIGDPDA
jgi:hypothetical protein